MSEYQYYEFQALDRPLTPEEMREMRAVSTRASITTRRFVNEYHWGDFKGRPSLWMEKYFDAFLYFANWGTRQLMLRLPSAVLDVGTARRYCVGDSTSARSAAGFTILEFHSDLEGGGDWVEDDEDGRLSSIVPLRADLAAGDHRVLYLAWLLCVQEGELDEDEPEPPVPPGLGKLTASLDAFADFLRIDEDLVAAAAERSAPLDESLPRAEIERWVAALPGAEKDRLLIRVAVGEGSQLRGELLQRFREARRPPAAAAPEPRTVAELLEAMERCEEQRRRREAEQAAREKARREQEAAAARERRLDALATREDAAWRQVDALIAAKKATAYDQAVRLLDDLRALAAREGREALAEQRIRRLREEHSSKRTFLERLDRAGLGRARG